MLFSCLKISRICNNFIYPILDIFSWNLELWKGWIYLSYHKNLTFLILINGYLASCITAYLDIIFLRFLENCSISNNDVYLKPYSQQRLFLAFTTKRDRFLKSFICWKPLSFNFEINHLKFLNLEVLTHH